MGLPIPHRGKQRNAISTNDDRAPAALQDEKNRAELEKLELEIQDLQRPWYRRPITYINAALAASAVVGVAGQGLLSNIRAERTLLNAEQAKEEARIGREDAARAEQSAAIALRKQQEAEEKEAVAGRRRQELNLEVRAITAQLLVLEVEVELESVASRGLTAITQKIDEDRQALVVSLISEQLAVSEIDIKPEMALLDDLGADSLDLVERVMSLEEAFDVEIPDEDVDRLRTVGDVFDYAQTF